MFIISYKFINVCKDRCVLRLTTHQGTKHQPSLKYSKGGLTTASFYSILGVTFELNQVVGAPYPKVLNPTVPIRFANNDSLLYYGQVLIYT